MEHDEIFATEITGCSSCGGSHHVLVVPLDEPITEDGVTYTHGTICSKTGDEVLIKIIPVTKYLN